MKRALIVITSDIYVRNYLRTAAFSELSRRFVCDFVADARVRNREDLERLQGFKGYFSISENSRKLHEFHFNLMMWRHRKKSQTFTHRWFRNSGWHNVQNVGNPVKRMLSFLSWLTGTLRNPHGLRIPVLASSLIFPAIAKAIRKKLAINQDLSDFFSTDNYDIAIFPSSAFDAATVDVIRLGRQHNIKTLCLIDNWDNLTSKTVFWELPDFLGVWGLQAKSQALSIHGFSAEQVEPVGTPRFDSYFKLRQRDVPRHYEARYALFVGSAMPFDELGALRQLEEIILRSPRNLGPQQIIYRPHPWQQKRRVKAVFDKDDFSIVKLDTQIEEAYLDGVRPETTNEAFQPELGYYPSLLRHAEVVIGPLTTMLLEAALALRPVIGLSYFDGHHSSTSLRYFSHFEGTEKIPGFTLCESQQALEETFWEALATGEITPQESDSVTQYFVFQDRRTYPKRLADLALRIVSE